MKDSVTTALTALGHIQILNDRCPAVEEDKRKVPGLRPAMPPRACSRKAGHEGPHASSYATRRFPMSNGTTTREMPDLCEKCGVRWPCGDAAKVIRAFDTDDTEEHF